MASEPRFHTPGWDKQSRSSTTLKNRFSDIVTLKQLGQIWSVITLFFHFDLWVTK